MTRNGKIFMCVPPSRDGPVRDGPVRDGPVRGAKVCTFKGSLVCTIEAPPVVSNLDAFSLSV